MSVLILKSVIKKKKKCFMSDTFYFIKNISICDIEGGVLWQIEFILYFEGQK